jgi:hypothetical protein
MPIAALQPLLETITNRAAADPYCTAATLTEHPAAFVSFQRQPLSVPPT